MAILKKIMAGGFGIAALAALSVPQVMAGDLVNTVTKGCEREFNSFCKDVTPGEGRLLACLYAHEDKITPRCEFALYDAAAQLERAVTTMVYLVNECRDDLSAHCAQVQPGEGRIIDCMEKNKEKLSKRCKQAIIGVGGE